MKLGDLEVELDEERVLVKLTHCLSSERLAATGTPVCDVERGIIDGVLEDITGTEVLTKETMCWSLGDTVCQFEGYSGKQAGYLYNENGFHPVEQRRLLTQLADQADVALDNLRLLNERKEHETHDPLTGLLNFRSLRERAAYELARAERHGRHGRLRHARPRRLPARQRRGRPGGRRRGPAPLGGRAHRAAPRAATCVCRYGADEFLLVHARDGRAGGRRRARTRARRDAPAGRRRPTDRPIALTASAGVADLPERRPGAEELVAKAATTMYTARAVGARPGRRSTPGRRAPDLHVAARVEILVVGCCTATSRPPRSTTSDSCDRSDRSSVREVKEVPLRGRGEGEVLREEGRRLLAAWPQAPVRSWRSPWRGRRSTRAGSRPRCSAPSSAAAPGSSIGGSLGLAAEVRERADDAACRSRP